MKYLGFAALLLAPVLLVFWLRERHWAARARELRAILDSADALEQELQECRARLREIPALVANLPPAMTLSARATLIAEPQVQAALQDLLEHRLWIREHGANARLPELISAHAALVQSRAGLATQLQRLAEVCAELAEAREGMRAPER